jgi:hypothetical protein
MKLITFLFLLIAISFLVAGKLAPVAPNLYEVKTYQVIPKVTPTPTTSPADIDKFVNLYSDKYGKTRYEKNRIKALLHYLLLREQNYGGSDNCGDSGKACGPLQFHEPTYIGYRKIMIQRGLVKEIGSRLLMANAIETAAWAISDGREQAWGPVARDEIKI